MLLRPGLWLGVAAAGACAVIGFAAEGPPRGQALPPATAKSLERSKPAEPMAHDPDQGLATKPSDPFGVNMTLIARPIVYLRGSGKWDSAFATISSSLKKVESYMREAGLKAGGLPMTIFTSTDDTGFEYEAALPISEQLKNPPHGEIAYGQSPEGHAFEFVHRGSYESLDDTYEAITNYLDEKRLEPSSVLIEQYVTDPASADEKNLVVNILVLIK